MAEQWQSRKALLLANGNKLPWREYKRHTGLRGRQWKKHYKMLQRADWIIHQRGVTVTVPVIQGDQL